MCVGEIASDIHIYLSVAEDRLLLFASSLCKSQLAHQLINRNQALVRATFFHLETVFDLALYIQAAAAVTVVLFVAETMFNSIQFQEIAVK